MKKVIVSVTNDLVTDQRVHKVSLSLQSFGFDVCLVGRELPQSQNVSRPYTTKRMKLFFNKGPLFYAEYNLRLFFLLLFSDADIFLSNDLDSLSGNFLASKLRGKHLVYDSHELFTQVPELINRPKTQSIWEKLEELLLPKVKHSYTVCQSLADYYHNKYGIDIKVVRNIPKQNNTPAVDDETRKPIILYQGAVNIGRGIELMIKAMKHIDEGVFWIIGSGDIDHEVRELTKTEGVAHKVKFIGRLPFAELSDYTRQAKIGISLEEDMGLNYRYALPNKIFDYIRAGVPVIGSDLPEIQAIVKKHQIGEILTQRSPENLANQINLMLNDETKRKLWISNLKRASNELTWENEEKTLMTVFKPFYTFAK